MRTGTWINLCLTGCSVLSAARSFGQMQVTTEQYIQTYRGLAEEEEMRTGVPAAISLAQGIVETDSGNGWLVLHSNNHFGIKCKNDWTGETIRYNDDRKHECFRKYDNAAQSWRDHSNFLRQNPRYAFLFRLDPRDYSDWALGLKRAGYATMPDYAQKLIRMIDTYHLQQYTMAALSGDTSAFATLYSARPQAAAPAATEPEFAGKRKRGPHEGTPTQVLGPIHYPQGVFRINRRKVIYVAAGTSLPALVRHYAISLARLRRYNELGAESVLKQGQLLYLQRKAKKGSHARHQVLPGETMQSISQVEGIRLSWLCHRNNLPAATPLTPGEELALRGFVSDRTDVGGRANQHGLFALVHRLFGKRTLPQPAFSQQQAEGTPAAPPAPAGPVAASRVQISYDTAQPPAQSPVLIEKQQEPAKRTWPSDSLPARQSWPDSAASSVEFHTVQKGDTLYNLSKRYGVSIAQLQEWNRISGSDIHLGEQLRVSRP